MQKNFYCPICQTFKDGKVLSVNSNRVNDITVIKCNHCGVDSTCYLPANTIPKITIEKVVGEGEE